MNPAFSPDGKTLAFVRSRGSGIAEIFLLPFAPEGAVRGNEELLPLQGFERALNGSPAWTPDGRELIFVSSFGGAGGSFATAPVPESDSESFLMSELDSTSSELLADMSIFTDEGVSG